MSRIMSFVLLLAILLVALPSAPVAAETLLHFHRIRKYASDSGGLMVPMARIGAGV